MNTSAMSLNLPKDNKIKAFASKMLERTDKLAQKTIGFLKTATLATAMTASTFAAEGGIIWTIDHFFDNGKLTKEILLAFNKNKTLNNPNNNTTISNDTLQYDNFPDSASVAINEQESNPEEDSEGGDDGNDGDKDKSGGISNNTNPSTPPQNPEVAPPDPKYQMLAFLEDYPETGSDNYNGFINRLNKTLNKYTTAKFKDIRNAGQIQGEINVVFFASRVTDDERAKLKKIADKLNEVYGWNLRMPKEPGTPNYNATMSHKELLKNEAYKMSYEYLLKNYGVEMTMDFDKVAGTRALTLNEQKAYLLANYRSYTSNPGLWTTKNKKSFLTLYYHKSYAQAPAGKINTEFAAKMRKAKQFLLISNVASDSLSQTLKNIADFAAKIRAEEAEARKKTFANMDDGF